MELSSGITGFFNSKINKPPQVDEKQFKQLCFAFVLDNKGRIIKFHSSQNVTNFYYAQVEIRGIGFYILLNKHYPYLAFASVIELENIQFIDIPVSSNPFAPFYKVLDTYNLNLSIEPFLQGENTLNSAELKQISYWKPKTMGQVIFNYWD